MQRFNVNVYIGTSLRGPGMKTGRYAAIVEYTTSKGIVTREIKGSETDTTYYRSVLLAIVKALEILNAACSVTIYTECVFVKNIAERGSVESWKRSEWVKPSGKQVKNKELWQQYLEQMEKHEIAFRFSKHNGYEDRLEEILGGK